MLGYPISLITSILDYPHPRIPHSTQPPLHITLSQKSKCNALRKEGAVSSPKSLGLELCKAKGGVPRGGGQRSVARRGVCAWIAATVPFGRGMRHSAVQCIARPFSINEPPHPSPPDASRRRRRRRAVWPVPHATAGTTGNNSVTPRRGFSTHIKVPIKGPSFSTTEGPRALPQC